MKVIDFISKWKKIEFYTRKFNEKEYDFDIEKWIWEESLWDKYLTNELGNEFTKMLVSEIVYVKQEIYEPRLDVTVPQITQAIIITIKEKDNEKEN